MSVLSDVINDAISIEHAAEKAAVDEAALAEFLDGLTAREDAENKADILVFVRNQLDSNSPKTKKLAKKFLKKWEQ